MRKRLLKRGKIRRALAMMLVFVMTLSLANGIVLFSSSKTVKAAIATLYWPVRYSNGNSNKSISTHIGAIVAGRRHRGIDIGNATGCKWYAAYGGVVYHKYTGCITNGNNSHFRGCKPNHGRYDGAHCNYGAGNGFVIRCNIGGRIYFMQYAHMNSVNNNIREGQTISAGTYLGTVGDRGFSFGTHAHFEINTNNPYTGANINNDPASKGCVFKYNYGSNPKPSNNQYTPEGYLDAAAGGKGIVSVSGWALDRDKKDKKLTVHIYIGGPAGTKGAESHAIVADKYRKDVGDKIGQGYYHSFNTTVSTNKTGSQKVYAYGINVDKNGKNGGSNFPALKNSWTVNIKKKIDYKINTNAATEIKNKDATISGTISDSGKATKWGFYCGTNSGSMTKFTVSTASSSGSTISTKVAPYTTLNHGTTYYYKMWAVVDGKEITDASPKSFTTTSLKPEIPTAKVASASQEIGIEDAATVNWNEVDNADYYILKLYDSEGKLVHESDKVTGTKYAFPSAEKAGTYTCNVSAYSDVGTKGESESVSYIVHPDVKVIFKDAKSFKDVDDDYEPAIISEQDVHWGSDAVKPTDPEHKGYTFKEWKKGDETGVFTNVKENITLEASYTINSYTVKYIDSSNGEVLDTKTIEYYEAAPDVDYQPADGFKKIGYDGWDKEHNHITEDTTLYTCTGWYNDNYSVHATVVDADREYDKDNSDNEGYTIKTKLIGKPNEVAKGRLVVALKTSEGKLLTSTESAAFRLKKDEEKTIEVFVPYTKAAKQTEVFVVGEYGLAVPISNNAIKDIKQEQLFTDWSTEKPNEDEVDTLQSRKEYQYSDQEIVKSYEPSLEGYTADSWSWVQSGSGSINYVSSFPSGFSKSSGLYTSYNKKPYTAYENATNKRTVSTKTKGYLYFHWCKGRTSGPGNNVVSDCYEAAYPKFHAFESSSNLGYDKNKGATYSNRSGTCKDSYWWDSAYAWSSATTQVKTCSYTDYRKQYTHSRWKEFSDWSTEEYTASDNRKVNERTVYRYISNEQMQEDDSGEERTISGSLDASLAGKEATLFIYKVDEASDYTNEYVGQTVLDENGGYSFRFKLREEPTKDTGDFTVTLGVEGSPSAIVLDSIEAPKPKYTVNFYNGNKELISTQEVVEGENAELPEPELYEREGYTFKRWSATNVNIQSDMDIYAKEDLNEYDVVFVDWASNSVKVEKFAYGSQLVTPIADAPEEGKNVSWEILSGIKEGDDNTVNTNTVVTNNLVVGTVYTDKEYQVQIQDENNRVVDTKKVKYGKAVALPEKEDDENGIFLGWENVASGEDEGLENTIVSDNMIVCPVYVYNETVKTPTASIKTGVYNSKQIVELASDTPGASIYYTLDGQDPTTANGKLYEGPITVDSSTEISFYAAKMGMNNSETQTEYYSVNLPNARSKWLTYEQLPDDVIDNMGDYNVESDEGYSYKNIRTTTSLAEASELEELGWTYDDSMDEYTEYSDWYDDEQDNSDFIEAVEDEPRYIYEESSKYKYSHFVYSEGGNTYYSRTAVEGKDCIEESTENLDNKLKIAGFEDEKPYYIYDGQIWYNQEEVITQVKVGTKHRYKYKKATYYKWSDYSLEKPSIDESREYKKDDVYSYELNKKYLVTVVLDNNEKIYTLVDDGASFFGYNLDLSRYNKQFDSLYEDAEFNTVFDEATEINSDLTLYAKTSDLEHEVIFRYDEENVISVQNAKHGESVTPPEVEEREGYIFVGWDTDGYKEVTSPVDATAKYVKEEDYATVELDNEAVTLYQDKSIDLTAAVTPNTYDGELTWESSDTSVASVSDNGKVTAHSAGIANITVKVNETGETATCKVSVKTDINSKIVLLKNSKLRIDDNGYLREVRAGSNTVAEITNDFENDSLIVKDAEGNVLSNDDVVGTGSIIYLMKGKNVADQMEVVVVGDSTGDGYVDNKDVSYIIRYLLNKEVPTDSQILASNVDGDRYVSNRDAALISRSLVGKDEF